MGGGDDGLKIIKVVKIDVFQICDGRLDVARQSNIDEENRAISAGFEQRLELLVGDDRLMRHRPTSR